MLISIKRSNLSLVFLKAACLANVKAEWRFPGSSSYVLIPLFGKFSNTWANNNISL